MPIIPRGTSAIIKLVYHNITVIQNTYRSLETEKVLVVTFLHQDRCNRDLRVVPDDDVILMVVAFHVGVAGTQVLKQHVVLWSVQGVSGPTLLEGLPDEVRDEVALGVVDPFADDFFWCRTTVSSRRVAGFTIDHPVLPVPTNVTFDGHVEGHVKGLQDGRETSGDNSDVNVPVS